MIVRINWQMTPYYLITIQPAFGNLGIVIKSILHKNKIIYTLESLKRRGLIYRFYKNASTTNYHMKIS